MSGGRRRWRLFGGLTLLIAAGAASGWWLHSRGPRGAQHFEHGSGWHGVGLPTGEAGPRPLLIILDPGGRTRPALERYAAAAELYGWHLASSRDIYNGTPSASDDAIMESLIDEMASRHEVDRDRVYLAGFSGAGVQAYLSALSWPDVYAGAIAEGAHTGGLRVLESLPRGVPVYVFTRYEDFNNAPSKALVEALSSHGIRTRLVEAWGGHAPMDPEQAIDAVGWLIEQRSPVR